MTSSAIHFLQPRNDAWKGFLEVPLSQAQCQSILDNYKILQDKIKSETPPKGVELYHDFTASEDLFISFRRTKTNSNVTYMDFWIQGEKYRLSTSPIIRKIKQFLSI